MFMLNNFRYNLFIVITLFCNNIFAQKVIFNNPVNNYLLYELENPIDYLVEDLNCNNINFKITNAEFTKYEGCKLLIKPTSTEPVVIEAYINNKLIDSTVYKVEKLKPNISLSCPYENERPQYNLAKKLLIDLNQYQIDIKINIGQYEMIVVSNKEIVLRNIYYSSTFNEEQKTTLLTLKKGDLIIIRNIKLENFDKISFIEDIGNKIFEVN